MSFRGGGRRVCSPRRQRAYAASPGSCAGAVEGGPATGVQALHVAAHVHQDRQNLHVKINKYDVYSIKYYGIAVALNSRSRIFKTVVNLCALFFFFSMLLLFLFVIVELVWTFCLQVSV